MSRDEGPRPPVLSASNQKTPWCLISSKETPECGAATRRPSSPPRGERQQATSPSPSP
ncbi:hypothetical protein QC764_304210 [Podospora pseudoanserina]|nr:hypothetical protein QC764_304210 [Podospora pseudoanserina]